MTPPTVLFWDIDGTLLTTARAGVLALEEAAREVTGRPVDLAALPTAGLTDLEVAALVLETCGGGPASPAEVRRLLRLYESYLPQSLPRRAGRVLPNVREVLESLRGRADVISLLLTGNTREGARAKLGHYGLTDFFANGAFCDEVPDRVAVAREALALARRVAGGAAAVDLERTFVIGDTPHDIACARAIGARALAVATGSYGADDLRAHGPWRVVDELPPPTAFATLVGLERVCAC